MAEVIINTNLNETRWLVDDYIKPYIRMSGFDRFMGEGSDAIFRVFGPGKTDGGKDIIVPLVGSVKNLGVSGSQVLEGNEVDLETFVDKVQCNWRRNAIKVPKSSSYRTNLDILRIAGPSLRDWAARIVLKVGIINNMQGIIVPGGAGTDGFLNPDTVVNYANATAAQRNAFLVANKDRILFGVDPANSSSNVWATSLGNVDTTADKMSTLVIDQARVMASATSDIAATGPAIEPYMTEDGEEWYVMFVNRYQMRDLRRDPAMLSANRDAMERGKNNPLFRNGDLLWNGVIIREVADIPVIAGVGASGADVAQAFMAGKNAVTIAWGQKPRLITSTEQDYQFRPATAVEELIGIKKTSYNGVQFGGVTVITTATAT